MQELGGRLVEELRLKNALVTVAEAATYLKLSRATVYRLMEDGTLEYVKLGRSRRISRSALEALVARNTVGPKMGQN